jgi:phosphate-selective porin OprO/OprP
MRKTILALAAAVLALTASEATAKTVEEVLKEKGVITEAEYKEVTASRPSAYAPGKGFTFTSPDRNFQLSLGGRGQFFYQFLDRDTGQDVSQFRIRRFKVYLGGYAFTSDLTYRVQADLTKSNTAQLLDDAWINYRFADEAQAQAGQFKVPFLRQELVSDGAQQFVDRSNVVDAFKPSYDIGAMGWGSVSKSRFAYSAGIFGGAGQGQPRTGNNSAYAIRAAFNPLGAVPYTESALENYEDPRFSVGADYYGNTLKKTGVNTFQDTSASTPPYAGTSGWLGANAAVFDNTEKVDIVMYSVDGAFKWRGLSAQAEYVHGSADGEVTGRKVNAAGMYAQAGYLILPKHLEVAARYAWYDPNDHVSDDLVTQVQGAVSWYFYNHNLKVQTDYTNIHAQKGAGRPTTDDQQVRLQAQLAF